MVCPRVITLCYTITQILFCFDDQTAPLIVQLSLLVISCGLLLLAMLLLCFTRAKQLTTIHLYTLHTIHSMGPTLPLYTLHLLYTLPHHFPPHQVSTLVFLFTRTHTHTHTLCLLFSVFLSTHPHFSMSAKNVTFSFAFCNLSRFSFFSRPTSSSYLLSDPPPSLHTSYRFFCHSA